MGEHHTGDHRFANNLFFTSKEDVAIDQISMLTGTRDLILPHWGWSRVYLLLGIHHTLVWNTVL